MALSAIKEGGPATFREIIREASSLKDGRTLKVSGLYGSAKAFLLSRLFRALGRPMIVLLPGDEEAEDFAEDTRFFLGKDLVYLYPSPEVLPFDAQSVHPDISSKRLHLLDRLLQGDGERPFVTVSSGRNLMQRVIPRESLRGKTVDVRTGAEVSMDSLMASLNDAGYSRMSMVEERGEMSVRGGIMDVFPPGFDAPLRIEFFGDTVESIRPFDISSQRSLREMKETRILPASEIVLDPGARTEARDRLIERAEELSLRMEAWDGISRRIRDGQDIAGMETLLPLFYERLDTFFDYLGGNAVVAMIDPSRVFSEARGFEASVKEASEGLDANKAFFVRPVELYLGAEDFISSIRKYPSIELETLRGEGLTVESSSNSDIRQEISLSKGKEMLFKPLSDRINSWLEERVSVLITAHNKAQAERTRELFAGYGMDIPDEGDGRDILDDRGGGGGGGGHALSSPIHSRRLPGDRLQAAL